MGQVEFPEELPISAHVREIARAIDGHPVVIVAGETGSGKTTQLPKIALAMGRGLQAHIGVTQPRRIAATSVAARVAEELGVELGKEVGYQIRFQNRTSAATYVKFMTDGILLAELQGDPMLRAYDTIILDEAHERTLNVDFLLGVVKRLLPQRPDLRVVISSATLEVERFSAFFGGAPVIQVSGRTFPVEVIHRPPTRDEEGDLAETIANVVEEITELDPREDILVFLPGEREIREAMDALASHGLPHTELLPLYGRLSQADQAKVFTRSSQRRVVLATNVAETSLTIPGIVYVVDSGLARINRYVPRSGVTQLLVEPIARASADQRKGRAGRVRSGVAFRLYEEADFTLRPAFTDPEILRVGLAGSILQMRAMGLGPLEGFPFLDPPPKRSVDEGYRVLEELGALDGERALTEIGKKLSRLPVDPRIGRMILAGAEEGALREVVVLAAALGIQDPRERPLAAREKADQAHRRFRDEKSDFASLLRLWRFFHEQVGTKGQSHQRRFCRENFLSYLRMREWIDVHEQLVRVAKELGFTPNATPAADEALHRALLPGLLSRVGMWQQASSSERPKRGEEPRAYLGARQTRFQLHPSSGLAKKPPPWVIAAELVETSQLFGRTAAAIDPTWLEAAGGSLCRRAYGEASWSEKSAEVMIRENVSLYGLPIVRDRRVRLGPIDPTAARKLFLLHALVRGEYTPHPTPPFLAHNQALFARVAQLRDRARKSDLMADEVALSLFFEKRVPDGVFSGKTFESWRKTAEVADPRVLFLSMEDVLAGEAEELTVQRFPDAIVLGGATFPLAYRFDPSAEDDGVTLTIPLPLLPALDPGLLEWTIPGWQAEKIGLLLHWMPKSLRKDLGSIDELVATLVAALRPFEEPFLPALRRAIHDLVGVSLPSEAFEVDRLPPHLRFHLRVVDGGRVVGEGRDLGALAARLGARAAGAWADRPRTTVEREGLTTFGDPLPREVAIDVAGVRLLGYPALVDTETAVAKRLFPTRAAADVAMRAGLRRLFLLQLGTPLTKLEQQVPQRIAMSTLGGSGIAAPRRQIVLRALEEAFSLDDPARHPRDAAAFTARLVEGRAKLAGALAELGKLGVAIVDELDPTRAKLESMVGKPGAPRASLDDMRTQLQHLVGPDLFELPRERLVHLPRYLRGIEVRLTRLPNGPQKDLAKAEQVAPLWSEWLARSEALRARGVPSADLTEHRWLLEELRIAVFAPELKTAVPVSPQRIVERWREMASQARGG